MPALPPAVGTHLHRFAEVRPAPGQWRYAVRATVSCAIALLVTGAVFGPTLAILGLNAAMVCTTAARRPPRARVPITGVMTLAYVLSCTLGALVGGDPLLGTVLFTAVAAVASLTYHTLLADPPGPIFLIIGPALSSYLPTIGIAPWRVVAVNAVAAGTATLVAVGLQTLSPDRPEREAVEEAERQVDELLDPRTATAGQGEAPSETQLARRRDDAYAAVLAAIMTVVEAGGNRTPSPRLQALAARLRDQHERVVVCIAAAELPGARVLVDVLQQRRYLGSPDSAYLLRWGLSRRSFPWFAARRASLAILLTCVTIYGSGLHHPYWAVMTTALVMSLGTDRLSLTHRALHRLAGTIGGVGVFAVLQLVHPQGAVVTAVALACVFGTQMTAPRNYGIAMLFVTPMALVISTVGISGSLLTHAVWDRVLDTLVGVGCSLLVMWATGYRTPVALVRRQFRRTLRALERVLLLLVDGEQCSPAGLVARRNLAFEELQTARILRIGQEELPRRLSGWERLDTAVNLLVFTTLTACWVDRPLEHLDAQAMANRLQRVLVGLPPVSTEPIDVDPLVAALADVHAAGVGVDGARGRRTDG